MAGEEEEGRENPEGGKNELANGLAVKKKVEKAAAAERKSEGKKAAAVKTNATTTFWSLCQCHCEMNFMPLFLLLERRLFIPLTN